ncbi:energy-coupling factor transporter transmembrane component T [Enterococcus wangshanyuanii]|uniref:Cobalt transporter n=1 Tax=Enterococcus wangshanyuanii TaxID=2005703 RepID=A0ABQ1NWB8_9ENTE|nr:energy-coupling factor transporter transmembrane component T [Enterococcus wangshanyuanii]GGC84717.1 cobalt transporter [Enterococcus wangshanyuanii]
MNKFFFERRHPLVITAYYSLVLVILMSTTNPLIIFTCFLGSFSFRLLQLNGQKKGSVLYPLVFLLIITITNPLFVHRGGTILFFFLSRPVTKEAFIYGFFMGLMIAGVIYLFQNLQSQLDLEQFYYLFGQRFPKLALILTMVFRFIPLFQRYYHEMNQVQKTLHRTQNRSFKQKVSYGLDLFGNLFSWSLENAMDTASSMKARGYGIGKRSSRVQYNWQKKDSFCLIVLGLAASLFMYVLFAGSYQFDYYPYVENLFEAFNRHWENYLWILILAFVPTLNRLKEAIIWTILKSKI